MIKKSKALFLSLVACASLSHAEDDGGFFTVGYELGQVMQDVKNPGGSKRDELARELNATTTNNILGNNTGGNIVGSLSNAFSQYLYTFLAAYPPNKLTFGGNQSGDHQQGGNTNDVAANALLQGTVGQGTCASAGTHQELTNNHSCTSAGYFWLPSLSEKILQTIGANVSYGTNTTFPNMQKQITYLDSANIFFNAVNGALSNAKTTGGSTSNHQGSGSSGSTIPQTAITYLKEQQTLLNEAANLLKADSNMLQAFNSTIAGQSLNSAQFTDLVQAVITQSQGVLEKLTKNTVNASAVVNAGITSFNPQATNNVSSRAMGLPSALLNAQRTLQKISALNAEVKSMPYLPQFRAGNSRATNIMNGFYTKFGFKQFFGKRRNLGVRYYGFFSYNGAQVGFRATSNDVSLFTYGVGADALYNIFSRSYQNRSVDMGFFSGMQLAGETFNSTLKNDPNVKLHGKLESTHFQFLFDFGMRMNFGKLGEKTKRHNQHTVEIGVQVPTIYNTYYKSAGTTVKYFRPYSVYWSYGYSF
ncbi:outer membrane protein [Helicobacter cetorum]|uniref:Outer membrane porin and adhesin HopC n=1 Tax=Helicobacter cetorum (strain ATCC BAA-540 / CCUG 52418 / MIT 99-5656) TaxID=1163745 RepID=I0ER56_HELCM|nr:outer membrane protein [Helicobacter cetorum]AFI05425.1 outer membrane porin and adhesin HopC [Helicobacter cetorum MIT 99-5656]